MSYFVVCLRLGGSIDPIRYRTYAAAQSAARECWGSDESVLIVKARRPGRFGRSSRAFPITGGGTIYGWPCTF